MQRQEQCKDKNNAKTGTMQRQEQCKDKNNAKTRKQCKDKKKEIAKHEIIKNPNNDTQKTNASDN